MPSKMNAATRQTAAAASRPVNANVIAIMLLNTPASVRRFAASRRLLRIAGLAGAGGE
jgi:hypothetical protein